MTPGYLYYYSSHTDLVERAFNAYHLVAWWSWVHKKWFDYRADRIPLSDYRIPDTAAVLMRVGV
jgi:hypothetical protein